MKAMERGVLYKKKVGRGGRVKAVLSIAQG
jgi:hypothetical protein